MKKLGAVFALAVAAGIFAPASAATIGEKMPDGSVYAGVSPDDGKHIYATPEDAPRIPAGFDIPVVPGRPAGLYDAPSAKAYCRALQAHGHGDWFLPSIDELAVLYNNHAAIGNFQTRPLYSSSRYWSSEPFGLHPALWMQDFSDGKKDWFPADPDYWVGSVRCIRKP